MRDPFLQWLQDENLIGGRIKRYVELRSTTKLPHIMTFVKRYKDMGSSPGINAPYNIVERINQRAKSLDLSKLKDILQYNETDLLEYAIVANGNVGIVDFLVKYGQLTVTEAHLSLAVEHERYDIVQKYKLDESWCIIY